jgi:hypothetical protein
MKQATLVVIHIDIKAATVSILAGLSLRKKMFSEGVSVRGGGAEKRKWVIN